MSLTLELSRDWESSIARHHDRYHFTGVDPQDSDLPPALVGALAKVGAGGTASHGELTAAVLAHDDSEAAGYLPLLFTLKHNAGQQADLAPLAGLAEPYARPDTDDAGFYAAPRRVDHLDAAAQSVWRELTRISNRQRVANNLLPY